MATKMSEVAQPQSRVIRTKESERSLREDPLRSKLTGEHEQVHRSFECTTPKTKESYIYI